ncbi:hypothetical protein ACJIZ3_009471 [Penstemon smallii]|uniref:NAB domain-containing protein n=1 Tax=Penstemon smallii TaxID=265156 RepID=A0ABD3TDF7_9LAMI
MKNEVQSTNLPWWNSHISQKNTEWLAENVKVVDDSVKEMLLLIKQDGDISIENDLSNLMKPQLLAHINEISHRHHMLADHYSKLTGELRSHIQSETEMENHEGTIFCSQQNPSFQTPAKKLEMHNVEGQVVSSDISLNSGGGISDASFNEDSGSSAFSSDSDSESFNSRSNERPSSQPSGKMRVAKSEDYEMLLRRVSDYEEELKVSNQKLKFAEEEIAKLKSQLQNNEEVFVKMGSIESQLVSAKNQIKLQEADIDLENKKSLILQGKIVELEANFQSEKRQVLELQESVNKYKAELLNRDLEIQKLSAEIQDATGNFALEKWQLESCISKLSERLTFHEARTEELQMESESLTDEIKKHESRKVEMEREQKAINLKWQNEVEFFKAELCKKNVLMNTLNGDLDILKHKHDNLTVEKDGIIAKLQTLNAELSDRDNQIQLLEYNLQESHSENKRLTAVSESENMQKAQLKSRIDELEKELGMQRVMISERAEEKREAIRQLCFSLDHFRSAYEELRGTYVMCKRPTAVV